MFARIGEAGGATAGVAWYLTDYQGTVQDVVSNAGTVLDQRTYDAFGNITSETDPAQGDRYGFQGMQLDGVTGIDETTNRPLNTRNDKWLVVDQSGLRPDSDPTRPMGNDPTNLTDPSGLAGRYAGYSAAQNSQSFAWAEAWAGKAAIGVARGFVEAPLVVADLGQALGDAAYMGATGNPAQPYWLSMSGQAANQAYNQDPQRGVAQLELRT